MRVAAFPSHLDSNPYCDLLYNQLRRGGVDIVDGGPLSFGWLFKNRNKVDLLHFHWIERYYRHWRGGIFSYLSLARFILLLTAARAFGYRFAWTMHNFSPHESSNPRADRIALTFLARHAVTAVHCVYAEELLRSLVPDARVCVIEHGSYIGSYASGITRDAAREALGIGTGTVMLLFFGMIRRYKGLESLCEAFNARTQESGMLLLAGKPYEEDEEAMVADMMRRYDSASIRFVPEYIPDDEVAAYFLASDYCVFPFENVLTSGSVLLSLGFGRPIIAPRIGCLAELEESGVGIFYDAGDGAGLERAIARALRNEQWTALCDNAQAFALGLDWKVIAEKYRNLYNSA
jgi:beta-1,4-mannosyltransferase